MASITGRLEILHVRIPRSERNRAEMVWNYLREDVLDSERVLRLQRNGIRVGVGRKEWWDAIKAVIDGIDGHRVDSLDPIRVLPGYPLGLELDLEPHDQNLFVVEEDGILSGETWPSSRNALRVTYVLDRQRPERVLLGVVPEVRQRMRGWQWVRTESGLWQIPKNGGRAFPAAGFRVPLEPGEFVLLAPSAQSHVAGLIGHAFLTEQRGGPRYDSYIFISPDITYVREPD